MNSTPPSAAITASWICGAVWPTYLPMRSLADTLWQRLVRMMPILYSMVAIMSATMVLPVPGLPWNTMCMLVAGSFTPWPWARLRKMAKLSRPLMAAFTFSRPTIWSSRSSSDELV